MFFVLLWRISTSEHNHHRLHHTHSCGGTTGLLSDYGECSSRSKTVKFWLAYWCSYNPATYDYVCSRTCAYYGYRYFFNNYGYRTHCTQYGTINLCDWLLLRCTLIWNYIKLIFKIKIVWMKHKIVNKNQILWK